MLQRVAITNFDIFNHKLLTPLIRLKAASIFRNKLYVQKRTHPFKSYQNLLSNNIAHCLKWFSLINLRAA